MVSEGLLAVQVLDGLLRSGRAAGGGSVKVHRQRAVAGNTRLLLWCRCWYCVTHVGAVVVLCNGPKKLLLVVIWRFVFRCTCGLQGIPLVMRAAPRYAPRCNRTRR